MTLHMVFLGLKNYVQLLIDGIWDQTMLKPDGSKKEARINLGFIAQEVLEIEKEHGFANDKDMMLLISENNDGNYGMKYDRVVPILVNAIKELSTKNTALETRVATLEAA